MKTWMKMLLAGGTVAAAGCDHIMIDGPVGQGEQGSGVAAKESRDVNGYTAIETDVAANVDVQVGGDYSLKIEGDDNLLKKIRTKVKDGTLTIDSKENLHPKKKFHIHIVLPKLESFSLNGAGNGDIRDVSGSSLSLELNGAGNLTAGGNVDKLEVSVNGAGNAKLFDLKSKDARVSVNGAGNMDVYATGNLTADVNGVGNVRYKGHPSSVSKDVNGVGRVSDQD